ncbi:GNAT family N-acetyltransferase [Sporosalibacterium faouarense]|uniref:GNAT family N-acetyltransferase n=1 Tax=Sporosalibacterium faouarense TaxID=516123 RepID=UPI00192C477D|nr:GNAT family N-acetyltransferase [Sporosalibacterium faouarense]
MILGRKINVDKDLSKINKILKNNNIDDLEAIKSIDSINKNDIIYVLEDKNRIIGVCKITVHKDFGIFNYIVISDEHRGENLGDGLVRAIFNYCLRNCIKTIIYFGDNKYIIQRGFEKIGYSKLPEDIISVLEQKITGEELYICDLEYFFSKGCKCKER